MVNGRNNCEPEMTAVAGLYCSWQQFVLNPGRDRRMKEAGGKQMEGGRTKYTVTEKLFLKGNSTLKKMLA